MAETAPAPSTTSAPVTDATAAVVDASAPPVDGSATAAASAEVIAPVIPDKYEFKGEDGQPLLSDEVVTEWSPLLKEIGLTNENAQKLVQFQAKQQAVMGQQLNDALAADDGVWMEQTKSDPEIGGVNFQATLDASQAFLAKYGNAAATAVLKDSRLGNHPDIVRMFAAAAKDFPKNDALPGQMANVIATAAPKSVGESLYPNTRSKSN